MTTLEDKMNAYKAKLDAIKREQEAVHKQDLAKILEMFSGSVIDNKQQHALLLLNNRIEAHQTHSVRALITLTDDDKLKALDAAFYDIFEVDKFYPNKSLRYKTTYCDTLEEFFKSFVEDLQISKAHKEREVLYMCQEAELQALRGGGGIYGVNCPSEGCYINGWLFAYPTDLSPKQVLQDEKILREIKKTVVHEKLGHGFLDLYSSLGKVESELGAFAFKIAEKFGSHMADDPMTTIRQQQHIELSQSSLFLQEGWATWLESYFDAKIIDTGSHPKYSIDRLLLAIATMPINSKDDLTDQQLLSKFVVTVLTAVNIDLSVCMQAVNYFHAADTKFQNYFFSKLGQPLRYVIGELIFAKIEANWDSVCVPYAALIAGNITMDPEKISLSDLKYLLENDPTFYADARLVMVSSLIPEREANPYELAKKAEKLFDLQVPQELKKRS
jgi:hypothetical protein